jgi:hypothetical protein
LADDLVGRLKSRAMRVRQLSRAPTVPADVSFLEGTARDLEDAAERIAALQAEYARLKQRERKRDFNQ